MDLLRAMGGAFQNLADNAIGLPPSMQFRQTYRCFPVVMADNENLRLLEAGDKIVLPASALDMLARLHVAYPMLFQIANTQLGLSTHCGVMEFSAREGICYVPHWLMDNLALNTGDMIQVTNVGLPKGTFVQLQPHKTAFVQLSNPKAILERALRQFTCLTKGSTIVIPHAQMKFKLDVVDVKPGPAISIVETDVNVDFLPPKDDPSSSQSRPITQPQSEVPESAAYPPPSSSSFSSTIPNSSVPQTNGKSEFQTDPEEKSFADHFTDHSAAAGSDGSAAVQPSAQPTRSSSGSSYFAKLGKGHSLSGKNSQGQQPPPKQKQKQKQSSRPQTVSSSSSLSAPAVKKRIVEESNGYRYIYEVDAKTEKKRLVRRVPIPKTSYFSTDGHRLSKRKPR